MASPKKTATSVAACELRRYYVTIEQSPVDGPAGDLGSPELRDGSGTLGRTRYEGGPPIDRMKLAAAGALEVLRLPGQWNAGARRGTYGIGEADVALRSASRIGVIEGPMDDAKLLGRFSGYLHEIARNRDVAPCDVEDDHGWVPLVYDLVPRTHPHKVGASRS